MGPKEMLMLKIKCDELAEKGEDMPCDECPLYKEVELAPEMTFHGSIGYLYLLMSPCMMLGELAGAITERDKEHSTKE